MKKMSKVQTEDNVNEKGKVSVENIAKEVIENCSVERSDKIIVIKENGCEVRFDNSKELPVKDIVIDGCVIKDGLRCDRLINVVATKRSFLIELKGGNVEHAMKQLRRTYELLKRCLENNVTWIVSYSGRNPAVGPAVQVEEHKCRMSGIVLIRRRSPVKCTIS